MDDRQMTPILVRDLLMNMLLGLTALVVLVLAQINPAAKDNPDALPPPGTLAVLVAWPEGAIDVDTWVKSPDDDKPAGYPQGLKSRKYCALLRDDLGTTNDGGPFNAENVFCRSLPAGEYIVNIHGFAIPGPVMVHIEVALNGSLLVKTDMEIRAKQERTVVRFTLDGRGMVVPGSQSQVFKALRSAK
jgi:hypothetical protein